MFVKESTIKNLLNDPVVKFGEKLAEDWQGYCMLEERVPRLYDYVQKVCARGNIHPRYLHALADYFNRLNIVGRLPKKIVFDVTRRARRDVKNGDRTPPQIVVDDEGEVGDGDPMSMAERRRSVARWMAEDAAEETGMRIGSDIEVARAVLHYLQNEHGQVVFADGAFWRYERRHWAPIPDGELRRAVHDFDGITYGPDDKKSGIKLTRNKIDGVLREMAAMAEDADFFREAAEGINCQNGFIVFSKDGEPSLQPHHPSHRARHTLPGRWDDDATSCSPDSLLDKLLLGCFDGDDDDWQKVDLLAEIFGAAALGYATRLRNPMAIVFHGQRAQNGKSQVIEAGRGLLPPDAVSAIPPGKFSDPTFACQLAGKLLNAADELSGAQAIGSDVFKAVITGEPIAARNVYQPATTFRPSALHIFATNTLPSFQGGFDRGVQRRLLVVPFNRVVPEAERIEHLGARIAEEEPDLLLAFAVEGACRLIANRRFTQPDSSKAALRNWIFGADPVLAWIEDRTDIDLNAKKLPKSTAYADFKAWATREGFNDQRLPAINNFVARAMAQDHRIGEGRNNDTGRYFLNLALRTQPPAKKAGENPPAAELFA